MFGEVDVLIDNIHCDNLIDISFYLQLLFYLYGVVIIGLSFEYLANQ
jgi:hypothetical protein